MPRTLIILPAIDNVTRKLMQEGKRPDPAWLLFFSRTFNCCSAGFVGVYLTASALQSRFSAQRIGSVVGTSVSAIFLLELRW